MQITRNQPRFQGPPSPELQFVNGVPDYNTWGKKLVQHYLNDTAKGQPAVALEMAKQRTIQDRNNRAAAIMTPRTGRSQSSTATPQTTATPNDEYHSQETSQPGILTEEDVYFDRLTRQDPVRTKSQQHLNPHGEFTKEMPGFNTKPISRSNPFPQNKGMNTYQTPDGANFHLPRRTPHQTQVPSMQQISNAQTRVQSGMMGYDLTSNSNQLQYNANQAVSYPLQPGSRFPQYQIMQKEMQNSQGGFTTRIQGSPGNLVSEAPNHSSAVPYTRSFHPPAETMTPNDGFITVMGPSAAIKPSLFPTKDMNAPTQTYAASPINYSQPQDQEMQNSRGGFATVIPTPSTNLASNSHQFAPAEMNTAHQSHEPPPNPTIPIKSTDTTPKRRREKQQSASQKPELTAQRPHVNIMPKEVPPSSIATPISSNYLTQASGMQKNSNSQTVFPRGVTNFDTVSSQPPILIDLESANILIQARNEGFLQNNSNSETIPNSIDPAPLLSMPKTTKSHIPPPTILASPTQAGFEVSPSQIQPSFLQNADLNPHLEISDTPIRAVSKAPDLEPPLSQSIELKKRKRKAVKAKRLLPSDTEFPATTNDTSSSAVVISPFQKAKTPMEITSRPSSRASANTLDDILSAHFDLNKDLDRPLEAKELFKEVNKRRTKKAQQQRKPLSLISREKVEDWLNNLQPKEATLGVRPSPATATIIASSTVNRLNPELASPAAPLEPLIPPKSRQPGYKPPSHEANQNRYAARKQLKKGHPVTDLKERWHGGMHPTTKELIITSLTNDLGLGPEGRKASNTKQANLTLAGNNTNSRGVTEEPLMTNGEPIRKQGKKSKKINDLEEDNNTASAGETDTEVINTQAEKDRSKTKTASPVPWLTGSHTPPIAQTEIAKKASSPIELSDSDYLPETISVKSQKLPKSKQPGYRRPAQNYIDLRKNAKRALKLGHPVRNLKGKWHGGIDSKTRVVNTTSLTADLGTDNDKANLTLAGLNRHSPGISQEPLKMDGKPLKTRGRKSQYYDYAPEASDIEASGRETNAKATSIKPKKRRRAKTASPTPPLEESYVPPTTRSSARIKLPSSVPVTRTRKRLNTGKKS